MYEDKEFPPPPEDTGEPGQAFEPEDPAPAASQATGTFDDALLSVVAELQQLSEQVSTQDEVIAVLTDRLAKLEENPPKDRPDPWNLREANDEQQAIQWEKVAEWISWFNTNYAPYGGNDLRVPECWYLHPHGRMILLDLFYAWRAAQYGHRTDSSDATFWDTNHLPNAMRVARENSGWSHCISKHNAERTERPAPPVSVPVTFKDWLEHGENAEPTPKTDQIPVVTTPVGAGGEFSAQASSWQPRP